MKNKIPVCKVCERVKRFGRWTRISKNQMRRLKKKYDLNLKHMCPSCINLKFRVRTAVMKRNKHKPTSAPPFH